MIVSFAALYAVSGLLKISPIIGLPGYAITAAAIIAPLIGIILGLYIGTMTAFLGGVIGVFFGSFSLLSLSSGIIAALCGGLTHAGRRIIAIFVYLSLLLLLAFYPTIGSAWLYPMSMWFQIIVLVLFISPLQSIATKSFRSGNNAELFYAFFVTALTSTLAGQIAGSLTLEVIQLPDPNYWRGTWQVITFLYPIERIIIALGTALIGVPLYKVLRASNFVSILNHAGDLEKCP